MSIYISHIIETDKLLPIIHNNNLGIEVTMFGSPIILDNIEEYNMSYKRELEGIKDITFHGPFTDLSPASRDLKIRAVTSERLTSGYNMALEYNAKAIVYHTGYIPNTYVNEEWLANSIDFWSEFTENKLENIKIHIENVYEADYILIKRLVEKINHPNFTICFDIGHVNAVSNKPLEFWIKDLCHIIGEVHLHNNDGNYDNHYGLSKGTIDMVKALELIKREAPSAQWTLEILSPEELHQSVEFLKSYGYISI